MKESGQNVVEDAWYLQSIAAHFTALVLENLTGGSKGRLVEHLAEGGGHKLTYGGPLHWISD